MDQKRTYLISKQQGYYLSTYQFSHLMRKASLHLPLKADTQLGTFVSSHLVDSYYMSVNPILQVLENDPQWTQIALSHIASVIANLCRLLWFYPND